VSSTPEYWPKTQLPQLPTPKPARSRAPNEAQSFAPLRNRSIRHLYAGEQLGKLDDATRDGLRKYQQAEGLKVTGTLNKITLEKMNITLTEKQKSM
jgi:hypothetical protein